jgi:hypothetical protein
MKKCTYCGKEYPDTDTTCAADGNSLVTLEPPQPPSLADQRKATFKRNGWILLAIFLALVFLDQSQMFTGVVSDVFATTCLVAAIIYFISAARLKTKK